MFEKKCNVVLLGGIRSCGFSRIHKLKLHLAWALAIMPEIDEEMQLNHFWRPLHSCFWFMKLLPIGYFLIQLTAK